MLALWGFFDYFVSGSAKFVDKNGVQKPSDLQASELTFERRPEHMGKIMS